MRFSLYILNSLMLLLCNNEASAGQKVYVSSSFGSDSNNGLTQHYPVKSISIALVLGDTLLLKAGDFFYEGNLTASKGLLSRYGEGLNPIICGYKRIIELEIIR